MHERQKAEHETNNEDLSYCMNLLHEASQKSGSMFGPCRSTWVSTAGRPGLLSSGARTTRRRSAVRMKRAGSPGSSQSSRRMEHLTTTKRSASRNFADLTRTWCGLGDTVGCQEPLYGIGRCEFLLKCDSMTYIKWSAPTSAGSTDAA
jgi:hypothetical protein